MSDVVFLDTSLIAEDFDVVNRVLRKQGAPVISETVMSELNFMKDNRQQKYAKTVESNARRFFSMVSKNVTHQQAVRTFPNGTRVEKGDSLVHITLRDGAIYLLSQSSTLSGRTNDEKIINTVKHYNGILLTLDKAQSVIATSKNVPAIVPKLSTAAKPAGRPSTKRAPKSRSVSSANSLFEKGKSLKILSSKLMPMTNVPQQGAIMFGHKSSQRYTLGASLARGGEGEIFEIVGQPNLVAKVYFKTQLTAGRIDKLMLMTTKEMSDIEGMCWPIEVLLNEHYETVGFVQPKAYGQTVFSALMSKPRLARNYPHWQRLDLVKVCQSFLKVVGQLHQRNVLMGDINPNNMLIDDKGKLYFVDTDSYQVEGYPCTVGTVNFTAPEIQGRSYDSFLRTQAHEMFAVMTFVFMVLMPGKTPYAQQGGGSQSENIRNQRFPYPFDNQKTGVAPKGAWRFIWSEMPYNLKKVMYRCFADNQRPQLKDLATVMNQYAYNLRQGGMNNALFPSSVKILDPVQTPCYKCGQTHEVSKSYLHKLVHEYKKPGSMCPDCRQALEAKRFEKECESIAKSQSGASILPVTAQSRRQSSAHQASYGYSSQTAKVSQGDTLSMSKPDPRASVSASVFNAQLQAKRAASSVRNQQVETQPKVEKKAVESRSFLTSVFRFFS